MKAVRLCILGRPGSGKGTVSSLLNEKLKEIKYYNVGQILRERAMQGDAHIKETHQAGGLVSTDKVLDIIENAIQQDSFILDGSPRRPEEAKFIVNHLSYQERPVILIHLNVSDDVARARLQLRNRFDDLPEVIDRRFKDFDEITRQSIEKFREVDALIEVDASLSPDQVVENILKCL